MSYDEESMTPDRSKTINGKVIEGFYWAGEMLCYVDNQLATVGYDEAIGLAEKGEPIPLAPG